MRGRELGGKTWVGGESLNWLLLEQGRSVGIGDRGKGPAHSRLGAGVVRDLLHNLAVTFVPHDFMVPTQLKEGRPLHGKARPGPVPHPRHKRTGCVLGERPGVLSPAPSPPAGCTPLWASPLPKVLQLWVTDGETEPHKPEREHLAKSDGLTFRRV